MKMKSFVRSTLIPFVVTAALAMIVSYTVIQLIHRFSPTTSATAFSHTLLTFPTDNPTDVISNPIDDVITLVAPSKDATAQGACGCPYCCSVSQ